MARSTTIKTVCQAYSFSSLRHQKLFALVFLILLMSLCVLSGCTAPVSNGDPSGSVTAAPTTLSADANNPADAIAKGPSATKKLIVGFDASYPPYGYRDEQGNYTGFDIDLAREVARRQGWELELSPIDWDAKDALLNSGAINAIWNGFTRDGRENDYSFSDPYMLNAQVFVVKKDSLPRGAHISGESALDLLNGQTVLTQTDSAAYHALSDEKSPWPARVKKFKSLDTIGDYNTAFLQLQSGAVFAVACDSSIAAYQMKANPGVYELLGEPIMEESYAVGLRRGDEPSCKAINQSLKEMNADGFIQELCKKYADQGVDYSNWELK